MINIKPDILSALQNDSGLFSLLGNTAIYQLKAPSAREFPRITFYEYSNIGLLYADDTETESEISVQIDVFCMNGATTAISIAVDRIMKSIGFFRISSNDLYEDLDDLQIYHKAMRYSIIKEC